MNNNIFKTVEVYFSANLIVRFITFLLMPILSYILDSSAFGIFLLFNIIVSFATIFSINGMDASYSKQFNSNTDEIRNNIEIFIWRYIIISGFIIGFIAALFWFFSLSNHFNLPKYLAYYIWLGIFTLNLNIIVLAYARLYNRLNIIFYSLILSSVFSFAIAIIGSIFISKNEIPLIISAIVTNLIPIILIGVPIKKIFFIKYNLSYIKKIQIFKFGILNIITGIFYWTLTSADKWFLNFYTNIETVGIYSLHYGIAITGSLLNVSLTAALLPEASRLFNLNIRKSQIILGRVAEKYILYLALFWFLISTLGNDFVSFFISTKFHIDINIIPIISAGVFFYGVMSIFNIFIIINDKFYNVIICWLISFLFSLIINLLIVPSLGILGAALSYSLPFLILCILIIYQSSKLFLIKINYYKIIVNISGLIILSFIINNFYFVDTLILYFIKIIICSFLLIYISMLNKIFKKK